MGGEGKWGRSLQSTHFYLFGFVFSKIKFTPQPLL